MEEKRRLRQMFRECLPENKPEQDEKICRFLLESESWRKSESVFCYVSMPDEPDTYPILDAALKEGKTLLVPKCISKHEMFAVQIKSLEELREGAWGIPEPDAGSGYEGRIDLAVIPCVAASADGKRLGHGAGYYDRFLYVKAAEKICLCYEERICDKIPAETTDIRMDAVITQRKIYFCSKEEKTK